MRRKLTLRMRRGFTLIEILVGLTLFSVVILGLAGLQTVQSVLSSRNAVRIRAIAVMTARSEGWQAQTFTSFPTSGTTGSCMLDTTSALGALRFFRCDTVFTVSADQRQVSVNVIAPVNQKPGSTTTIPTDSNLVAQRFVRLTSRLLRTRSPSSPF